MKFDFSYGRVIFDFFDQDVNFRLNDVSIVVERKNHADKEKIAVPERGTHSNGRYPSQLGWTCCSLLPIKYTYDPRWKGVGFAVLAAND